jgi:hypothetical protein
VLAPLATACPGEQSVNVLDLALDFVFLPCRGSVACCLEMDQVIWLRETCTRARHVAFVHMDFFVHSHENHRQGLRMHACCMVLAGMMKRETRDHGIDIHCI